MSSNYESADLLLKLYDLRREQTMREARTWFAVAFHPDSLDEVVKAATGPNSGLFRMVISYWDMAAALVNHEAIDAQMFNETNGEHIVVFSKVEPFLGEYRARMGNPAYLANLEKLVMQTPDAKQRLADIRTRFKQLAAAAR